MQLDQDSAVLCMKNGNTCILCITIFNAIELLCERADPTQLGGGGGSARTAAAHNAPCTAAIAFTRGGLALAYSGLYAASHLQLRLCSQHKYSADPERLHLIVCIQLFPNCPDQSSALTF